MKNRGGLAVIAVGFFLMATSPAFGQPTTAFGGAARPLGPPPPVSTTTGGTRIQAEPPPSPGQLGTGGTATPAGASARFGAPSFSPEKLAFADVWDGASSRATLTFTANGAGKTSATLPNGPFRVSEMRVMSIGGATSTFSTPAKSVKTKQSSPPWEIASAAGEEIQIDVTFEPKFDLFKMGAGPKTASLTVKGPGPQIPWQMNVPATGVFNGKRIGVPFVANEADISAFLVDGQVMIPLTLFGSGTPTSGLIRAKALPPGTAFPAKTVSLGANETQKLRLPLTITNALLPDGTPRQVELVYDYGSGTSTTSTTIVPLPSGLNRQTGMRTDCGISQMFTQVSLTVAPDRSAATAVVQLTTFNTDPFSSKHTWVEVASNGKTILAGSVRTGGGNLTNPTRGYRAFSGSTVSMATYAEVVRSSLMVGCQNSDTAGMPTNLNLAWEKAKAP